MAEFEAHGITGTSLNLAAEASEATTGKPAGSLGRVDVRSVADKLAAQGRELVIANGRFFVSPVAVADPAAE
jgi:hypothetical protein